MFPIIGKSAEQHNAETLSGDKPKKRSPDADLLSSIEMAVLMDADAMAMQNFDHVERITT